MSDSASQRMGPPRPAMVGVAIGILFMAFFGAFWGYFSAAFLSGVVQVVSFLVVGLMTLGLVIVGGVMLRHARTLPAALSPEEAATRKRINMWFGIVFGIEFILIALASIVFSRLKAGWFIAPTTALIVGVHFFPLAWLFSVPVYYGSGALLAALALIALGALLWKAPLTGSSPYAWSLFVGVGATLVLWLTALFIARLGFGLMRRGA